LIEFRRRKERGREERSEVNVFFVSLEKLGFLWRGGGRRGRRNGLIWILKNGAYKIYI